MTEETMLSCLEKVKEAYDSNFLNNLCKEMGASGEDAKKFSESIILYGEKYLDFKRMNKPEKRLNPTEQKELLTKFEETAKALKAVYNDIQVYHSTTTKLNRGIKDSLPNFSEKPWVRKMLDPYISDVSSHPQAFADFLDLQIAGANAAPKLVIGDERKDISRKFLERWVGVIGRDWPECKYTFALGKYDKETGSYTSPSIDILHLLISRIDPKITKTALITAMRKAIKNAKAGRVANIYG